VIDFKWTLTKWWVVAFKMELHLSQKILEPGNVKKAFEV
jgi:hypothetical protein